MKNRFAAIAVCLLILFLSANVLSQTKKITGGEEYRPQIHFSPKTNWINDPNGMVYANGVYHLFYQHYPDKPVWGPMHWGHATSKDLIHWQHQPIALYPDSLGYIFSGSAVLDKKNTSGFGKNGKAPLVAIFTHHRPNAAEGDVTFQNQSIAYSNDDGKTWIKYKGNPVVKNPGIIDFRDPKVMWYEQQKKWIMTLATKDFITFYSSPNLKDWKKESEFGKDFGAHGGVWECPDLFTLDDNGKTVWVLLVNLNPGGPNKGSATQYFLGDFDGTNFKPYSTQTKWLDYGPDEYAGITWSNTGKRKIFIGWLSNWMYANEVPTTNWRNALTLPRELKLKRTGSDLLVASEPVKELATISAKPTTAINIKVENKIGLSKYTGTVKLPCVINLEIADKKNFSVNILNDAGEKITAGYDDEQHQYFIDRTKSGKTDFNNDFAAVHVAPRFTDVALLKLKLVIDVSSIELFADDGLTVMTEVFFPNKPYNKIEMESADRIIINKITYAPLKSIWHK